MYIYIYIYTHTHTHIYKSIHIPDSLFCVDSWADASRSRGVARASGGADGGIYMYLYIYIYTYIYIYIYPILCSVLTAEQVLRALLSVCGGCSFGGLGCWSCRVCVCRGCCSLSVCVCVTCWDFYSRAWTRFRCSLALSPDIFFLSSQRSRCSGWTLFMSSQQSIDYI